MIDVPHDAAQRTPLPEEKKKRQAAGQHVGAPLGGRRDDPGQHALESLSCHDAVLHGEEREQPKVDRQCGRPRIRRTGVQRLGHDHVAKKSDCIEKGEQEQQVAQHAVRQDDNSVHVVPLAGVTGVMPGHNAILHGEWRAGHARESGILVRQSGAGRMLCSDVARVCRSSWESEWTRFQRFSAESS